FSEKIMLKKEVQISETAEGPASAAAAAALAPASAWAARADCALAAQPPASGPAPLARQPQPGSYSRWARHRRTGAPPHRARAGRKDPAGEDAAHLTLQRHLFDLDEGVGVLRLGRRPCEAGAWRHLQRTELDRLADRHVEADDAACNLVEAGEERGFVDNAL